MAETKFVCTPVAPSSSSSDNVIDTRHPQSRVRRQYDRTQRDDPSHEKAWRSVGCCVGKRTMPPIDRSGVRVRGTTYGMSNGLVRGDAVLLLRFPCYDPCFEDHERHSTPARLRLAPPLLRVFASSSDPSHPAWCPSSSSKVDRPSSRALLVG